MALGSSDTAPYFFIETLDLDSRGTEDRTGCAEWYASILVADQLGLLKMRYATSALSPSPLKQICKGHVQHQSAAGEKKIVK